MANAAKSLQHSCLKPIMAAVATVAFATLPALPVQAEEGGFFDSITNFFNPNAEADKATQSPDAVPYTVEIEVVDGDRSLTRAIEDASNLKQLKSNPPAGAAGLVRRAVSDRDRIVAALYSEGYYGGTINMTISGNRPDSPNIFDIVQAARARGPVPVKIVVNPGPLFTFGTVRIVSGANNRPLPDAPDQHTLRLETDEPALASSVVSAEGRLAGHWRNLGYPFARVAQKDVVADHATRRLNVTFFVDTGPRATFGHFTVKGADFLSPGFIEDRIEIQPGEPFSPSRLTSLRTRLTKIEAIGGVRIIEGDRLDANGGLPITIEVTPRKPRYVGFNAEYSNTDGSSLNTFWGHRNLFGGGETFRLDAGVSWFGQKPESVPNADPFGYKVKATFTKPGIFTSRDDLIAAAAVLREVTNAYVQEGVTATLDVRRRFSDQFTMQVGLDFEDSSVEDANGKNDYFILGIPVNAHFDNTDNTLDPSRGMRVDATVEPFAYLGDSGAGPVMAKGTFSTYYAQDRDKRYILAGRVSAGSMMGTSLNDVPANRRFYVGGGGSLRGYDYQSASPRNARGEIIGGLSYFEASAEARIKITDTIGVVPFFDMGSAFSSEFPDFDGLKYSAGLGLRYYTAIGPLRFDLAFPLNPSPGDGTYGLYVSLGQSF
ncbi:autotransporter assembly complex protein TamA [Xanthobacter sp. TB0139]|uniref:autotransporter assembly complex protein TamA n=1 Tax=Xanthobacter sp. TB0139 TaxID=3459178 RepID=UPI004039286A